MASSHGASSLEKVTVVTQVLPTAPNREQQSSLVERHKFKLRYSEALGTVQIMIGLITLLFGAAIGNYFPSLGFSSWIFVWGSLIYITSGSVTVAAEKSWTVSLNILAAFVALIGSILYGLDSGIWYLLDVPYDPKSSYSHYYGGFSAVVGAFQFLELFVSSTMAVIACRSDANQSCPEESQAVVQTEESPVTNQNPPHLQAASDAPTQPNPEVAPNFKNPGDLGSAEPPAYQPN